MSPFFREHTMTPIPVKIGDVIELPELFNMRGVVAKITPGEHLPPLEPSYEAFNQDGMPLQPGRLGSIGDYTITLQMLPQ